MRTLTTPTDGMTLGAHAFRQSTTALLERTRAAVFGQSGGRCDEQKEDCKPHDHFGSSPLNREKVSGRERHLTFGVADLSVEPDPIGLAASDCDRQQGSLTGSA